MIPTAFFSCSGSCFSQATDGSVNSDTSHTACTDAHTLSAHHIALIPCTTSVGLFCSNVFALILEAKAVMNRRRCSNCLCESGPAEPRGMHSRSRRRRDRNRRHASLRAQAQSYGLKRRIWHIPRDNVAGATGQGNVDALETMHTGCGDLPSDTSPRSSETMNLQANTLDGGSIDLTNSGLESISHVERSSVDATSKQNEVEASSPTTCHLLGTTVHATSWRCLDPEDQGLWLLGRESGAL